MNMNNDDIIKAAKVHTKNIVKLNELYSEKLDCQRELLKVLNQYFSYREN